MIQCVLSMRVCVWVCVRYDFDSIRFRSYHGNDFAILIHKFMFKCVPFGVLQSFMLTDTYTHTDIHIRWWKLREIKSKREWEREREKGRESEWISCDMFNIGKSDSFQAIDSSQFILCLQPWILNVHINPWTATDQNYVHFLHIEKVAHYSHSQNSKLC